MRKRWIYPVMILIVIIVSAIIISMFNRYKNIKPSNDNLVVFSPHPTTFVKPLIEEYERRSGNKVEVIFGATGELEQAIEQRDCIDIMWGGSYYAVSQYTDYFENYWTTNELYYGQYDKNSEGCMTRFTDMPSVLIINTDLIGNIEINGYKDLLQDELKGKIAFANPEKSSSSFEHLINMIYSCAAIGDGDEWNYIKALCTNIDGPLLESSSDVYNGVAEGRYIVGLTFEEAAANLVENGAHVKIIYMEEGVVSTPDGIYLLKNSKHKDEAKELIDFLTGYDAQNLISQQLGRRSVRRDIQEPKGLPAKEEIYALYPDKNEIINNRESWIEEFKKCYEEVQNEKE